MGRLKQAGYKERFRIGILQQALARYNGMVKADQEEKQPFYRDKNWSINPENQKKQKKKKDWTGGCDGVIFVQSTPNGMLAKKFRKTVEQFPADVKIKIIEKGGQSMKSKLVRTVKNRTVSPVKMVRVPVGIVEKPVLGMRWNVMNVRNQLYTMVKRARAAMSEDRSI